MKQLRIVALEGDGIGVDVVPAATRLLRRAADHLSRRGVDLVLLEMPVGLEAYEREGSTLPAATFAAIAGSDGGLLGPVMNHSYRLDEPGMLNPSKELRKRLELFANVRPAHYWQSLGRGRDGVDLTIVRENTEGFYSDRNVLDGNGELRPDADTVMSVRVVTRKASERVARAAFELARQRGGKKKVTMVHKANVLRKGCGLFLEACRDVARAYPDVAVDDLHVDAMAMELVMRPERFDVIVTTNLFGDILSDLAAGLVGGLGMAPGLNVGNDLAVAQAVHGAAPDITGTGKANPVAVILSTAMLLRWLSHRHAEPALNAAAVAIEEAVADALSDEGNLTPDLGGSATTKGLGDAIERAFELQMTARAADA